MIEMHVEECADLIASSPLGRLAVIIDGHPEIFPVNHVYDHESDCVAFRSDAGTRLHAALGSPSVAFEVDGYCADGSRGWSVLVIGRVEQIEVAQTKTRLAEHNDQLWRSPDAAAWFRIVPAKMTGRRICNTDRAPLIVHDVSSAS